MKKFLLLLAMTALVGCSPIPKIPEIPEVPEVEIPEVEVPTTFPTIAPETVLPSTPANTGSTVFEYSAGHTNSCVAGYVETGPGTGVLEIYTPGLTLGTAIQAIEGISPEFMTTYEMDPC